jgi:hypothetical protein
MNEIAGNALSPISSNFGLIWRQYGGGTARIELPMRALEDHVDEQDVVPAGIDVRLDRDGIDFRPFEPFAPHMPHGVAQALGVDHKPAPCRLNWGIPRPDRFANPGTSRSFGHRSPPAAHIFPRGLP